MIMLDVFNKLLRTLELVMGTELGKMRTQEVMMMLENPEKLVVWTWS